MKITTVKEQTYNGELCGYLVNGSMLFRLDACEVVKQWIAQGNTPEPEFTEEELLTKKQNEFRRDRNILLDKVDKAINTAEDLGKDSAVLRAYRQALRDATITWTMPESVL